MEVSFYYNDYPQGGGSRDPFTIKITDPCASGLTVTAPSGITDQSYSIGSDAVTFTYDPFT